ncbi:MAG: transcription antitermination factor NusB [Myxococcota bacterium]
MAVGRQEREIAIQILYQLEDPNGALPTLPDAGIEAFFQNFEHEQAARDEATALVRGVCHRSGELDTLIEKHSTRWRINRMAKVDRNVLRLAAYELVVRAEVPVRVVLNEAVELGKRFGSENSSAFINGVLDPVAKEVRPS